MAVTFRQRAQYMISLGVRVVPALPGEKWSHLKGWPGLATTDLEQILKWNNENPNFNCISVPQPGTVWIADIDDVSVLDKLPQPLPGTLTVRTPSGGLHVYFKQTTESEEMGNRNVKNDAGEPIFECKINNLTAASPLSVTAKGVYEVGDGSPICEAPMWLLEWIIDNSRSKKRSNTRSNFGLHPDFDVDEWIDHYELSLGDSFEKEGTTYYPFTECPFKGGPHQGDPRKCCLIVGDGIGFACKAGSCDDYRISDLLEMLHEDYDPYPYYIYASEDESLLFNNPSFPVDCLTIGEEVDALENPEAPDASVGAIATEKTPIYNFRPTDTGNAERLVRRFGGRIRYVRDAGEWRVWSGKAWLTDNTGKVDRSAKAVAQEIFKEAVNMDDEERDAMRKWGAKTESRERRNAMVDLASKKHAVVTLVENYDQDPWLFNVQNGTIDLKTGTLKEHDRANMMTKVSPVVYDPGANCLLWKAFLTRVQDK